MNSWLLTCDNHWEDWTIRVNSIFKRKMVGKRVEQFERNFCFFLFFSFKKETQKKLKWWLEPCSVCWVSFNASRIFVWTRFARCVRRHHIITINQLNFFFFFLFTKSPFFLFLYRNRENEILFGIVSKRAIYIVPCSSWKKKKNATKILLLEKAVDLLWHKRNDYVLFVIKKN